MNYVLQDLDLTIYLWSAGLYVPVCLAGMGICMVMGLWYGLPTYFRYKNSPIRAITRISDNVCAGVLSPRRGCCLVHVLVKNYVAVQINDPKFICLTATELVQYVQSDNRLNSGTQFFESMERIMSRVKFQPLQVHQVDFECVCTNAYRILSVCRGITNDC